MTLHVHPEGECAFSHCPIHNPSDHPLNEAPLNWRSARRMFERVCRHGVGHPDPDSIAYLVKNHAVTEEGASVLGVHGCCPERCCAP